MYFLRFRIITAIILVGFTLHRGYYTRKIHHTEDTISQKSGTFANSRIVALLAIAALLATVCFIFLPSWIYWAALPLPNWTRWIGVLIALCGFFLLQWAQNILGKNWSDDPVLLKEQVLITSGPYAWIRHPIYSAFILILSSTLLISANWLIGGLWIGMTLLDITTRIDVEEAMMLDQFGIQYRIYMERTGKLFPRICDEE